ncbi:MAG: hypothetical protein JXL84_08700 [Deltaproteobacteria bacterium]|nr:hypothetical protein [Deltaproteobacteria bacterium]
MGFLKKLLGKKPNDKIALIREMVKERVEGDPFAKHLVEVESLSEFELMSLPEATLVTIVESYMILTKKQGILPEEALGLIENHRSTLRSGEIPRPLTLASYIKYRLALDHARGISIPEASVDRTIEKAKVFFSQFV